MTLLKICYLLIWKLLILRIWVHYLPSVLKIFSLSYYVSFNFVWHFLMYKYYWFLFSQIYQFLPFIFLLLLWCLESPSMPQSHLHTCNFPPLKKKQLFSLVAIYIDMWWNMRIHIEFFLNNSFPIPFVNKSIPFLIGLWCLAYHMWRFYTMFQGYWFNSTSLATNTLINVRKFFSLSEWFIKWKDHLDDI